jgi:hypothetical protein
MVDSPSDLHPSDAALLAIPAESVMDDMRAQAAALVREAPLPLSDSQGWHSQVTVPRR